jgi:hypothetical protein
MKPIMKLSGDWAEYVTGLLQSHQRMLGRITKELNILFILCFIQAMTIIYLLWRL